MRLLFTGDINFRGKENMNFSDAEDTLKEVKKYLDSAGFVIPNLECPLAEKDKYIPIKKSGPNLISGPENVVFLKAMGSYAVTLANNHTGDFGEGAIKETFDVLTKNDVLYAGAGENIDDAYKPVYIEKAGKKVSVISVCENEFGIATENTYGSAGFNPRRLLNQIRKEKAISDYVIVVFHGGNEFNPLPSPDTVDRYRLICDMGADAVIGGHTHCPQGYEIYDGKPIVYSMGNFLFKSDSERDNDDSWYYGYMSMLDIKDYISLEIIPYKFTKNADFVKVFDGDDRAKMMEYIEKLSSIIQKPELLRNYFKGWAYLHQWVPELSTAEGNFGHINLAKCESHHSQMKEILKIYAYKDFDEARLWADKIKELQKIPV